MAKKKSHNRIWVIGAISTILIIGVILYFATRSAEPFFEDCFQGEFQCIDNTAMTCSADGKWLIEVCRSPNVCGGGGTKGCGNPSNPQPYCGDTTCQSSRGEDKYQCPLDCGLPLPVCGNNKCEVFHYSPNLPPYSSDTIDEFDVCPQDCGGGTVTPPSQQDNPELVYSLTQKQRPLVGGLQIEMTRNGGIAYCSLGAIVNYNGQKYILTASHCAATSPTSGAPMQSDIGLPVKQGGESIGSVYKTADFTGAVDAALVSINSGINSESKDFAGNAINGFGTASMGLKVYKIGRTTGVTYGTITDINLGFTGSDGTKTKGFRVTGDNGVFCKGGDSGAAIVSVSEHKIIGIISSGDGACSSNLPEDIKSKLGL